MFCCRVFIYDLELVCAGDNTREVPDSSSTASVPLKRKMSRRPTLREQQKMQGKLPVGETSRARPDGGDIVMDNAAVVLAAARESENMNRGFASSAGGNAPVTHDNVVSVNSHSREVESHGGGSRQTKRARVDRRRSENVGASSNSSGSVGRPFYWRFENSIDCPVLGDRNGVGYIQRHFKETGCALPPLEKMVEKEAYLDVAMANARVSLPFPPPLFFFFATLCFLRAYVRSSLLR